MKEKVQVCLIHSPNASVGKEGENDVRKSLIFDNLIDVKCNLIVLLICNPLINISLKCFYWFIGNLGSFFCGFLFISPFLLSSFPLCLLKCTFILGTNLLHIM